MSAAQANAMRIRERLAPDGTVLHECIDATGTVVAVVSRHVSTPAEIEARENARAGQDARQAERSDLWRAVERVAEGSEPDATKAASTLARALLELAGMAVPR